MVPSNLDPTERRALAGRTLLTISNQQELLAIAPSNLSSPCFLAPTRGAAGQWLWGLMINLRPAGGWGGSRKREGRRP